ncbi:hypothetical protein PR202_ga07656 [Eleusine coracana subsp. coracana]|uniref:Glutathione S-transferase n=1 Tax=Eleusine coracana subsp. coracana TaxID=191504 RepID=A0AAV5BZV1_ELECO|nr:hypothetical protein QOZ80_2AG0114610 [Eleusine coracana subsp. coracana]GJM91294.1 hypothetical protein PR202_ga07656 [Eleusine coracana subsp. coracana]
MAGAEVKVLGQWASVWVCRVRIALHLKGLDYEYVEEDFNNKSDLLLTSNPVHKKVPVLIHNGKPICESRIIVQYLDEAFFGSGPSLLPVDPHQRAIERFWAAYIDDKLVVSWVQAFKAKTEEEKAEGIKLLLAAMEALEGALRECSKGKPFFGGDCVGALDAAEAVLPDVGRVVEFAKIRRTQQAAAEAASAAAKKN